jgi:hypothetical protein
VIFIDPILLVVLLCLIVIVIVAGVHAILLIAAVVILVLLLTRISSGQIRGVITYRRRGRREGDDAGPENISQSSTEARKQF